MKKYPLIILTLFLLILCTNVQRIQAQHSLSVSPSKKVDAVPGVLYIEFKTKHGIDFDHLSPAHTGNAEIDQLFSNIGVTDIYPFDADAKNYAVSRRHGIDRMYVINFSNEALSSYDVANECMKANAIQAVCPRFLFREAVAPNDPAISQQYALDNMRVKEAWGISLGSPNIIIADVDEGVNYSHEDLVGHIQKIGSNFGYDVVGVGNDNKFKPDNDPMPIDGQSHGTNTSGCFGEIPDNNKGGAGTGYNCKIMAIRASDSAGLIAGGYEGIHYAVTHGANIVNCSWGGGISKSTNLTYLAFLQTFIDEATDTGALVIASAGNFGINIDDSTFIPGCLQGVFTIGATDQNDAPATQGFNTNYGHRVNVYAPGVSVYTTDFPGNSSYAAPSGTSFSCPLTAGVAGLLWAKNPTWKPKFLARQITETVDNVVKTADRKHYWGRVNALSALNNQTVPGLIISDYKIDGVDKGGLQYLNKTYSIEVVFKNVMASGSGIQATLLPIDGNINPNGNGYTVQQSTGPLGSMTPQQQASGFFKFTRDSTDNGDGSQLQLYFAISYGASTVQGDKYFDTIVLNVDITGSDIYQTKGVSSRVTNINYLGNTYPNPVSENAAISFELAKSGFAKLSISDIMGRPICIAAEGMFAAGDHTIHYDVHGLDNGVYFYKLETSEGAIQTKRMIVIH